MPTCSAQSFWWKTGTEISPDDAKREWSFFKNHMFSNAEGSSKDDGPYMSSSLAKQMLSSEQISQYDQAYGNQYGFASQFC